MKGVPFVSKGWKYYGDWEEVTVLSAAREGRLRELLDANPRWARTLKRLSNRRYDVEMRKIAERDERARLRAVSKDQPACPDCSGALEAVLQGGG